MLRRASRSTASTWIRFSAPSPASPASTPTSPIRRAGRNPWPVRDNSREQTMTADVRCELEKMVEDIRGLVARLRPHDQPLAVQLLEMAVLEIKSRIYGIGDEEFAALIDTLSGERSHADQTELTQAC